MNNNFVLPQDIIDLLSNYYQFDEIIDLNGYDSNIQVLKNKIATYNREVFPANYRIIFVLREPTYYFKHKYNLLIRNLQIIVKDLNIPNFVCLIITHQPAIKDELNALKDELTYESISIDTIDYYAYKDYVHVSRDVKFNLDKIEKNYIFLSNIRKKFRTIFFGLLSEHNLLDKGLVSYGNYQDVVVRAFSDSNLESVKLENSTTPISNYLVQPIPFTRINEDWKIANSDFLKLSDTYTGTNFKNFTEMASLVKSTDLYDVDTTLIQRAFLYINAETDYVYPGAMLSEKAFKGVASMRPFVFLASPGSLEHFKNYGFKTFSDFWDESYDQIQNHEERISAVFKIVNELSSLSDSDVIDLALSMQSVLEYNYSYLIDNFDNVQFNTVKCQIAKNLIRNV